VCDKIPDSIKPRWQCITLVFLVHFYTEVNDGQHMLLKRLNAFYMLSMRKMLGISWMSRWSNTVMLSRYGLPTVFTMLRQRRLLWLGYVRRMKDGRIPKYIVHCWKTQSWAYPITLSRCVQTGHEGTEYWPE